MQMGTQSVQRLAPGRLVFIGGEQGVDTGLAALFVFQKVVGDPAVGRNDKNAAVRVFPVPANDIVTYRLVVAHGGAANLLDGMLHGSLPFHAVPYKNL